MPTQASGLSFTAIRKYAEQIADRHNLFAYNQAADIRSLVSQLGGRVEVSEWGNNESLHVWTAGNFVIYVPPSTSLRRDRFTIAHELGHYFLHYLYPKKSAIASFGRGARNRAETEANVFASSLLMPEQEFTAAYDELSGDTRSLAARFDVSPAAVEVRCQVLGLPVR